MSSRRVLLLIIGVVFLVALPLAVNPRVHLRADAMSNTALANAVLRHGIPPRDPYIAGQPLHYHWAYNAAAAGLSALTGLSPLTVMVWLGPIGLAVLLASLARLVRSAGGGEGGAALAIVLVSVGLNGWGWLLLAMHWVAGEVGLAQSLEGGVSEFLQLVVQGYDMRLGFFASKAMVSTAFIWNLAFLAIALGALLRFLRDGGWRHGTLFALAATAAAYANVLVGAATTGLLAAGLLACAWWSRGRADSAVPKRALAALGLLAASVALTVPYLIATVGASAGREALVRLAWPDGWHLRGALIGLAPLWTCLALAGRPKRWSQADAWLVFLAAGFLLAFLVCRAVDDNQEKFPFVLAVLLAAYVGLRASVAECGFRIADSSPQSEVGNPQSRWRVRALWAVAATAVPTTALGLLAHACAPDAIHLSASEAAAFQWIARNTPREAVVVMRERSTLVPILARRDLYVPDVVGFHRAARCDPAVWRRRTEQMARLFDRGEAVPVLQEIARELGRPVVLVTRLGWSEVREPRLRLLFSGGDLQVWEIAQSEPPGQGRK